MEKEKIRNVLEVLLFVTNRPLTLLELSDIVGETQENVSSLISEMEQEMDARQSALQISKIS